jgi:Secretion system C-terminal sorting domain/CARDB
MKKLLLILLVTTMNFTGNAQIFSENFETSFPGQMTLTQIAGTTPWGFGCTGINLGGATCPISGTRSATFYVNSYAQNIAGMNTPPLNLANGAYHLKFKHIQRSWDGDVNPLYVRISNDNGANWTTAIIYQEGVMNATERTLNLNQFTLSATTIIQFAVVNSWGYATILDDISVVENTVQNDSKMISFDMDRIVSSGNKTIQGSLRNFGGNVINSISLKYQVNNETIQSQTISGLSVSPGQLYNFSHQTQWNAIAGSVNSIKVWVDQVNGVADSNTTDNEIIKDVFVSTGSTVYKPMIEKFTGSTCPPCASYNNATFNPFYTAENANFNYVAYQMNWPANAAAGFPNGDPYYTAEGGVRRGFYGVNSITSLWISGANYSTSNNQATLTTHLNTEAAKPGYFGLIAGREIANNTATVNYVITPFVSGNYTIQAAVIEKTTTGNVGSNGETSFKHVMMKMIPNASGTTITTTAGTPITGQISASLVGTFVEEVSDLEVIIFIQDNVTRQVLQSTTATVGLLSDAKFEKNVINIYPNPATNSLNIGTEEMVNVKITDLTGKIVLTIAQANNERAINIESLAPGMYMVNVSNQNINETIKLLKK